MRRVFGAPCCRWSVRMNRFASVGWLSVFSRRSTADGELVLLTTTMVGAFRLFGVCRSFSTDTEAQSR